MTCINDPHRRNERRAGRGGRLPPHFYRSTCTSWNLLMATTVTFKRPDGQIIQGYLAEPQHAAGAAAIVVIQEWWGVNEQIRGVADRLASAGYIPLVPDLYVGKSTVEAADAHPLL